MTGVGECQCTGPSLLHAVGRARTPCLRIVSTSGATSAKARGERRRWALAFRGTAATVRRPRTGHIVRQGHHELGSCTGNATAAHSFKVARQRKVVELVGQEEARGPVVALADHVHGVPEQGCLKVRHQGRQRAVQIQAADLVARGVSAHALQPPRRPHTCVRNVASSTLTA